MFSPRVNPWTPQQENWPTGRLGQPYSRGDAALKCIYFVYKMRIELVECLPSCFVYH